MQVEATIASCTDPTQIASLENLKKDLAELMDLTKEQLTELDSGQSTDPFEDEMKLFLSEISSVEQTEGVDDDFQSKIEAMKVSECVEWLNTFCYHKQIVDFNLPIFNRTNWRQL